MIEKKVLDGVGMSAALRDADAPGYLDPQEEAALVKAKIDFGSYCRGLAAEFLAANPSAQAAKLALRETLKSLENAAAGFDENERELFEHFAGQADEAIDVVARRNRFLRVVGLIWFRTPGIIKSFVIIAIVGSIIVGVVSAIAAVSGR